MSDLDVDPNYPRLFLPPQKSREDQRSWIMASQAEADEVTEATVAAVQAFGFGDYAGAEGVLSGVDSGGASACLTAWVWHLLVRVYGSPEQAALALSRWSPGDVLPPAEAL